MLQITGFNTSMLQITGFNTKVKLNLTGTYPNKYSCLNYTFHNIDRANSTNGINRIRFVAKI